jgi:hypothetical protein
VHVLENGICTEPVVRHLPGQHNQQSHGNGTAAVKAYTLDAFEDPYGPIVDDRYAGDLHVTVHENGDFVLSFVDDDGGRSVVFDSLTPDGARDIADGLDWATSQDIPEDAENDPGTRLVDWEYRGEDVMVGYDASGDVSLRFPRSDDADPGDLNAFEVVDLGVDDAAELVEALRDMADAHEDLDVERSASPARAALLAIRERIERRYNPDQLRDPGGEGGGRWVKAGAVGGALTDALKLAGKIDLGSDEKLLGSAKLDAGAGGARMALTERNGERMLRLGLGAEGYGKPDREEGIPAWDGNPTRARLTESERQRLNSEYDGLIEEDDTADPARQEQIAARLAEIREQFNADEMGFNGTAELDEYGARRLVDRIRPALDEALEQAKVQAAAWDEIEALEAKGNPDPARMAELRQRARADDNDTLMFVEGVVPGNWGDVHFSVELDEDEPYVLLGVKPKDTPDDWGDDKDWLGTFDPAATRKFLRLLDKFSATSSSASRAYSPESGSAPASSGPKGGQFALGGGRVAAKGKRKPAGRRPAKSPAKKAAPAKPRGPLGFDGKRGTGYGIKGGDPQVRTLQSVLTRLGFTDAAGVRLGANGKYGPRTTAAVKKLQKYMGLDPTGKVDEDFITKISNVKSRAELRPQKPKPAAKPRARKAPARPTQRPDRQSERQQTKRVRRSADVHEMDNGICRTCPPPHIFENGICTTC